MAPSGAQRIPGRVSDREQFDLFATRLSPSSPRIWSVGELTSDLKRLVEGEFDPVWVVGEVSNLRRQRSGHLYFSLKDDRASMPAVCFRTQARRLEFDLRDGLEVLAQGRLSVYEPHGKYQLIVDRLEPRGLGALQAAFQQLKDKLEKEGLFEATRKRPIPLLPRKVGVVTSPTGAALHDFLRVLHRRHPRLEVLIAPARVQGESAAREVARQVKRLDARGDCDVIVVTRGGGSLEDLWAFNEEVLARAMAACHTPLVTGIGHEIDHTIADFVADYRAPTPSAAAEKVAPELSMLEESLRHHTQRLRAAVRRRIDTERHRLHASWARVEDPRRLLAHHRLRLEGLRERVESALDDGLRARAGALRQQARRLDALHPRRTLREDEKILRSLRERLVRRAPTARLAQERARLVELDTLLREAVRTGLAGCRQLHRGLGHRLDGLSPLRALDRGYGLVRAKGRVVRRASDVQPGEGIQIDVATGRIEAEVTRSDDAAGPTGK